MANKLLIDACLLAPTKAGELRLVVHNEHDYLFKRKGKLVGFVTKKLVRIENCADATGANAKALWTYVREHYGHVETGIFENKPRSWETS